MTHDLLGHGGHDAWAQNSGQNEAIVATLSGIAFGEIGARITVSVVTRVAEARLPRGVV